MSVYPKDYDERVLEDIKNNIGLETPVKSGILRRLVTNKLSVNKIHPNPVDEFCDPKIGPNFGIVGNYVDKFLNNPAFGDPLIVHRIATGEYMILNGHHRWLAAIRAGKKTVPVQLVDVVSEEQICKTIGKSKNKMCVSFDFDEVILTDGEAVPYDKKISWPFSNLYKKYIRKKAPVLINELRAMGFDVWIYTGELHSVEYIKLLLSLHNTKVDGIINGLAKRKNRIKLQDIFAKKYEISVHVDNDRLICVDTATKDYEINEIEYNPKSWASDVMICLKGMDIIKKVNQ